MGISHFFLLKKQTFFFAQKKIYKLKKKKITELSLEIITFFKKNCRNVYYYNEFLNLN